MSGRILRIELRRSIALWTGGFVLVLTIALGWGLSGPWHKGSGAWDQQWTGLVQWSRNMLAFVWPLVLGAGAMQGIREHRCRIDELIATTSRTSWHRSFKTAAAMALALTIGYFGILAVGAARLVGTTAYFHLRWVPIALVEVLALVAGAWLGMGIGRLFPSRLTPPMLALAGLAVVIIGQSRANRGMITGDLVSTRVSLLSPVLDGIPGDAFSTVVVSVSLAQAGWFLALAATGFVLLAAPSGRFRLAAILPVILGGAVALPAMPGDPAAVFTSDPHAIEPVCTRDAPMVCVTRAHEAKLGELVAPARESLALLTKLPNPPAAVEEVRTPRGRKGERPGTRDPSVVPVDFDDYGFVVPGNHLRSRDELLISLLAGAGTPACASTTRGEEASRELAARAVAAAWLTGDLHPLPGYANVWSRIEESARQAWQALRSRPTEEQRARVAALRSAALACQGDLLGILVGGGRQ